LNVDELLTVILMVLVGGVTTAAFYLGLVGLLGALVFTRCPSCEHWTFTSVDGSGRGCHHCHYVAGVPVQQGRTRR
jgi:hypothetical protein